MRIGEVEPICLPSQLPFIDSRNGDRREALIDEQERNSMLQLSLRKLGHWKLHANLPQLRSRG
jgi:hypothetical protein